MGPSGELDDDAFPKSVQNFLEIYEKGVFATTNEPIPVAGSLTNPTEHQGKESQRIGISNTIFRGDRKEHRTI